MEAIVIQEIVIGIRKGNWKGNRIKFGFQFIATASLITGIIIKFVFYVFRNLDLIMVC